MAATQPAKIACPHCQGLIKSPAIPAGSLVNCPKCGQGFRLGQTEGTEDGGPRAVQGPKSVVQSQPSAERGARNAEQLRPQPPPNTAAPATTSAQFQNTGGQAASGTQSNSPSPQPAAGSPQLSVPGPSSASAPRSAIRGPRSPDTVDPNLLPPPPPKAKPRPTEVAVVCQLCGTRIHVKLDKAGQEVKCPDCFTRNIVPPLKEETEDRKQRTAGPSLEGTENYGMSEVVERPKYRPLQAARGEYEVLSALDPATIEHRLSTPGERPRAKAATIEAPAEREDGEVSLAPPVEIVEAARDPRTILPQPEMEPENAMYDGRYDDGVIGDMVDPRSPDAWKRAPFVYGVVEFLFYPSTLLRLLGYAIGVALLVNLGRFTLEEAMGMSLLAPFLIAGFCLAFFPIVAPLSAALYAIIENTGNGQQEVNDWPDWDIAAWMAPACYLPVAAFLTSFPGMLGLGMVLMSGLDWQAFIVVAAVPLVVSWMLLLPPAVYSQLAENSLMSLVSPRMIDSFRVAADAWALFYMFSIVIWVLLLGAIGLIATENILIAAVGGCACVVVLFLYARLFGRLMWVASQREARPSEFARMRDED